MTITEQFTNPLLSWFELHGRKELPWQLPRTPYHVWISEIMLQQTQVKTVIPYFIRFIEAFPDIQSLANATEDSVLLLWSGLGYYSRGRNLYKTALIIKEQYHGVFPQQFEQLINLPGIGETTAAAIISQAFNIPMAILDGNVKRVLSRVFMVQGLSEQAKTKQRLWSLANQCLSQERAADYTQAIMDLGATCCTNRNPHCSQCPVQTFCLAHANRCVDQFPTKKAKKINPKKQQQFLLLHHDKTIYLEKRPPTGIWGGLYCLPIIEMHESIEQLVQKRYGLDCLTIEPLLQIDHGFSHYQLTIHALAVEVSLQRAELDTQIKETNGQWYRSSELSQVGLAKPIKEILDYFYSV